MPLTHHAMGCRWLGSRATTWPASRCVSRRSPTSSPGITWPWRALRFGDGSGLSPSPAGWSRTGPCSRYLRASRGWVQVSSIGQWASDTLWSAKFERAVWGMAGHVFTTINVIQHMLCSDAARIIFAHWMRRGSYGVSPTRTYPVAQTPTPHHPFLDWAFLDRYTVQ